MFRMLLKKEGKLMAKLKHVIINFDVDFDLNDKLEEIMADARLKTGLNINRSQIMRKMIADTHKRMEADNEIS